MHVADYMVYNIAFPPCRTRQRCGRGEVLVGLPEVRFTARTLCCQGRDCQLGLLFAPPMCVPTVCSSVLCSPQHLVYPAALFFSSYEAAKHALDPKSPFSHMAAASVAETVSRGCCCYRHIHT